MAEPRLGSFVDSADTEAARFLWLRSFDPPIAVRVIRRGSRYSLISLELNGKGGYEPGQVVRRDSLSIDQLTWTQLTRHLGDSTLWARPRGVTVGLDGARWMVEAVSDGKLYIIDRRSPFDSGAVPAIRTFGLAMLQAAHISPDKIY